MKNLKIKSIQRVGALILTLVLVFTFQAMGATYYIDADNGDDVNNDGLSESYPWQHHPFMYLYNHNPGSASTFPTTHYTYTHAAGDRFIFKGGVTWTYPDFVINIYGTQSQGGASGNPDYYGVDPNWYSGSSWSRPVFDAGGYSYGFFWFQDSNVIIDNIDMTGFYWGPGSPGAFGDLPCVLVGDAENVVVENCYFHGWSHDTFANFYAAAPTSAYDNLVCVKGGGNGNAGCIVSNCVFDGAASSGDSGTAVKGLPTVVNCSIANMPNGVLTETAGAAAEVAYNTIGPITGSFEIDYGVHQHQHPNAVEQLSIGSIFIHNNYIFNATAVCIFVGRPGGPAYVYNNVIDQSSANNAIPIQADTRYDDKETTPAYDESTLYRYNNTLVLSDSGGGLQGISATDDSQSTSWHLVAKNNHFIGGDSSPIAVSTFQTSPVIDHNYIESTAAAATDGYSSGSLWKPTSGSAPTVDAGADLSSLSSTLPTIGADFIRNLRGYGTGWDIGAYEYVPSWSLVNFQMCNSRISPVKTGTEGGIGFSSSDIWNQLNGDTLTLAGCVDYLGNPTPVGIDMGGGDKGINTFDFGDNLFSTWLGDSGGGIFYITLYLPTGTYDIATYSYYNDGTHVQSASFSVYSGGVGGATGFSDLPVAGDTPLVIEVDPDTVLGVVNGLQISAH